MKAALALAAALAALVAVAGAQSRSSVPAFEHVAVIVFENKERSQVIGNAQAPTFTAMGQRYAQVTRYHGVAHPSLPNYLALVSGSTHGIRTDCTRCLVSSRNLADSLDAAHRSWKVYAEGLPRPGFTGPYHGRYAKKHVPFLYFRDVLASRARRDHVVPFARLRTDLAADALPSFSLIVPDSCHSTHDCSVAVGDSWLSSVLPPLLRLPDTVVFVVFDEGTTSAGGGGWTQALALGSAVRPGSRFDGVTSHYGLLRTIEDAWALPLLGRSARAAPITGIWR